MSTRKETNKKVCKTLWVTESLNKAIKKLGINVSDTCRKALESEVKRVSKGVK